MVRFFLLTFVHWPLTWNIYLHFYADVSEFPCNNATHGIASDDKSCKLRPSLTITSPDLNNGQNLCDDVVVNLTTLANSKLNLLKFHNKQCRNTLESPIYPFK